ncbi:MAG: RNA polymerase sigma factor [Planctomycetes bacterium]|nr:RNA polymerase sigma factor [Planctomycetota bacterium]
MERGLIRRMYEEHGPALLLYARALAGDASSAEDAVQQVFLRLLAGRVPLPECPRPYLFRAVRNESVTFLRGRDRVVALADAEPMFVAPPEAEEGERERLEEALAELPAEQREVVVLRTWGDLTFEEVAELVGVAPNTAASRWRYGLEKLRARLARTEVE